MGCDPGACPLDGGPAVTTLAVRMNGPSARHHGEATAPARPSVRRQRLELAVFLLLILPMFLPTFAGGAAHLSFTVIAVATIVQDVGLTALVLFFVWSTGEGFASLGWSRRKVGREVAIGVALFVPMFVAIAVVVWLLRGAGLSSPASLPFVVDRSVLHVVLALVLALVVACAEETIFRGYLLLRLRAITRSTTAAVVIAAVLFASGHAYQGSAGVVAVGGLGILFSLVYLWRGSLIAPIVMHFLQDAIGLIASRQ